MEIYEVVVNCKLLRARILDNGLYMGALSYGYDLEINYVDMNGKEHLYKYKNFKTKAACMRALRRELKDAAGLEWKRIN